MQSIQLATLDIEGLRTRLRKMSDVLSPPLDSRSKWRRAEIVCGSAGHNPHTRRTAALLLPIVRSI
jgi:hypothetical protein